MNPSNYLYRLVLAPLALLCLAAAQPAFAAVNPAPLDIPDTQLQLLAPVMPALIADAGEKTTAPGQSEILESLDGTAQDNKAEKKCMMVCERWGEDCVINPRTGAKKCRRMCKKLTQECF
ncbi:MAG: hypothetical protein R3318_06175 [Gammaproteobacteria bacterium]|nr:hypothetical protein [Gammaproteobacteria bacterium]